MTLKTAGCLLWRTVCPYNPQGPLRPQSLSAITSRQCSSKQADKKGRTPKGLQLRNHKTYANQIRKRSVFRPAPGSTHDWIGPPDRLSNLRPIIYHIPENETELEKRLRNLRQETEDWNHEFWTNQNITFSKEKETFIISQLKANGLSERDEQGRKRTLSSEEMAVFYKSFLDRNRIRHANYNNEWYRRNFTITFLMARIAIHYAWRAATQRLNGKKRDTPAT